VLQEMTFFVSMNLINKPLKNSIFAKKINKTEQYVDDGIE